MTRYTALPLAVVTLWAIPQAAPARIEADIVLINGKVITMDGRDSIAEAVAIKEGKILVVGKKSAVLRTSGKRTRVIDLAGRTATPGLIDTHIHLNGAESLYDLELSQARSIEDIVALVRDRVGKVQPGEWIRGRGWDQGKLAEGRYILVSDLDKVAPQNPVWLRQTTGHFGVANSAALKLAGINPETHDPPSGTIERDSKGAPNGILKEPAAYSLVTDLIPPYTRQQERDGVLSVLKGLNAEGITGVKNIAVFPIDWNLYRELRDQQLLSAHMFTLWRGGFTLAETKAVVDQIRSIPHPPAKLQDDVLISGGVKLFIDGSAGARTAWMYADWNKDFENIDSGNKGFPVTDPAVFRQQVQMIHDAGIHVGTHAIGDRAVDVVADTYAEVLRRKPTVGLRHGILHANTPSDHAISVMADLQRRFDAGYPEVQPVFLWWLGDSYAANLGPARSQRLLPLHAFLNRGVKWTGGSDFFVTPYPARYGIWASVVRQALNGTYGAQPFGTSEAVDVHVALRSYTAWAAHQLFIDDRTGSIMPNKDADIAIWDRDPYTVSAPDLRDMHCEMTLFRGRIVYRDEKAPIIVH